MTDSKVARLRPPRVLAIAEDLHGLVTACRMLTPLLALKRLGLVSDFRVTGTSLVGIQSDLSFDVVWLQRAVDERVTRRVLDVVGGRFLLDIDDLLISRPTYIEPGHMPPARHIIEAVRACKVLTTTSARLAGLLETRVGTVVAAKTVVCPNALEFPAGWVRPPQRPQGIVLTQGHRLALTSSAEVVFRAVREFARAHSLPVYLFGPPARWLGDGVPDLLGDVVPCGVLDFWHYHAALASWPTMIGIAPLETVADQETLDFIAGKSDIKMVEYGGFGHPAVYSDSPPYSDTDLRSGALASNTYEGWTEALVTILEQEPGTLVNQRQICLARSIDAVAPSWRAALDHARLPRPVAAGDLQSFTERSATVLLKKGAGARRRARRFRAAARQRRA